jgi:hypothetical protein
MAVDESLRLQVQAVYESNNLSVKKVIERFAGYEEIKEKTVESWVKKYGWVKNRFESEAVAIDKLIETSLPLADAKEIVKEKLKADIIEGDILPSDEKYAEIVGKEIAYKVLSIKNLQEELAANLERGRRFAITAKSIATVATHHGMLISTYQAVWGKQINLAPVDPNKAGLSEEDVKKLSDEELTKLISGV